MGLFDMKFEQPPDKDLIDKEDINLQKLIAGVGLVLSMGDMTNELIMAAITTGYILGRLRGRKEAAMKRILGEE